MTIEIDKFRRIVKVEGKPLRVKLAPREFDLLAALMQADGVILDRAGLVERLKIRTKHKTGREKDRVIDQHVARLRGKLGKAGRAIKTCQYHGYQYLPS